MKQNYAQNMAEMFNYKIEYFRNEEKNQRIIPKFFLIQISSLFKL
jgi:hypothetical protein